MNRKLNIPLTGNTALTEQILCSVCGKDSLQSYPDGFYHDGVCFHPNYACYSYICCRGDNCPANWINCHVCDTKHGSKSEYSRHERTKKHASNLEKAIGGLKMGFLKTRHGSGSKSAPIAPTTKKYEDDWQAHGETPEQQHESDHEAPLGANMDAQPLDQTTIAPKTAPLYSGVSL